MITCKSCGTSNEEGIYFCEKCGKLLEAASPAAVTPVTPVTPVAPVKNSKPLNLGASREVSPQAASPQTASPQMAMPQTPMPAAHAPSQKISEFTVSPFAVDMGLVVGGLRSGKLEIFTDKVRFKPGKLNLVDSEQTTAMSDIASVELCTVMMVPTGVKITTRGGKSFTYMAGIGGKREQIADAIRRRMAAISG